MVKTIISVDVKKPAWEQDPKTPLHNRWHPDIPAVARVKEGELFRVECICNAASLLLCRWRRGDRHAIDVDAKPSTAPMAPSITARRGDPAHRCIDWTGGQIKNDDCADDVKNVDLSQVHYLSGPIAVEGARAKSGAVEPGLPRGRRVGLHRHVPDNGGGFLTDHYPQATSGTSRASTSRATSRAMTTGRPRRRSRT